MWRSSSESVTFLTMRWLWLLVPGVLFFDAASQDSLLRRWVGTHQNAPLHLDFFGDTMVVLNDDEALSYRVTGDSLYVWGDTSFAVTYWFAADRLLLRTIEGNIVTMSEQDTYARPIWGRWQGSPIGKSERIELNLLRGGVASWRLVPGGRWVTGEWNRRTRFISFTWDPDSTLWDGIYDPDGGALLFDSTFAESGTVVLRKVYRR